jgi:hypothetical protein
MVGIFACPGGHQRRPFRVGLRERDAWRKPAYGGEVVVLTAPTRRGRIENEIAPQPHARIGKHEARGHHTDDRARFPADPHRAADGGGIAAECIEPQAVAQHSDARGTGLILPGHEATANLGLHRERREEVRRGQHLLDAHRVAAVAAFDKCACRQIRRDLPERVRLRAIVEQLGPGERESIEVIAAFRQEPRPDRYHAIRIGKRERPQQDAVDHCVHGGRRADAETQCEHRDEAEGAAACERASRMSQVAHRSREQEDRRTA